MRKSFWLGLIWLFLFVCLCLQEGCTLFSGVHCESDQDCKAAGEFPICFVKSNQCVPQWWLDSLQKSSSEKKEEPVTPEAQESNVGDEPQVDLVPELLSPEDASEPPRPDLLPEIRPESKAEKDPCTGSCTLGTKRECYSNPKGCTQNGSVWDCKGICQAGTQKCAILAQGKCPEWDSCQGEVFPESKESCDQVDNNCDGQIDEDCDCKAAETQACYTKGQGCKKVAGNSFSCTAPCQAGVQVCENGKWAKECKGEIGATAEVCDGKDNNCDGQIDENFPDKGKACTSSKLGICQAGTWKCINKLKICSSNQQPQTEICDGKDNNCNGQTDENLDRACYKGPSGTENKGVCRGGTETCKTGSWSSCIGQVVPSSEICDGKDNDCDNLIDESFVDKGKPCFSSSKGACQIGTWKCLSKAKTCEPNLKPITEACGNRVDDDCDGKTDEDCVSTFAGDGNSGSSNGQGSKAKFDFPVGLAFDTAGNLYVADSSNHRIRKIDKSGNVTNFAGSGVSGSVNGTSTQARFNRPSGLSIGSGDILYVADYSNHKIRKVDKSGNVTDFTGSGVSGSANGTPTQAQFNRPIAITFDAAGNLYVADSSNHKIRKVDKSGNVTDFAGSGVSGSANGTPTQAQFNAPYGLAFDTAGNLYVADSSNRKIRKVDKSGNVTDFAGSGLSGSTNGTPTQARFNNPYGLAFDAKGNLYVTDSLDHRIRRVDQSGNVTTITGLGVPDFIDGAAPNIAQFNSPLELAFDMLGNLYVADSSNHSIRKVTPK